jgi:hypothetical protein
MPVAGNLDLNLSLDELHELSRRIGNLVDAGLRLKAMGEAPTFQLDSTECAIVLPSIFPAEDKGPSALWEAAAELDAQIKAAMEADFDEDPAPAEEDEQPGLFFRAEDLTPEGPISRSIAFVHQGEILANMPISDAAPPPAEPETAQGPVPTQPLGTLSPSEAPVLPPGSIALLTEPPPDAPTPGSARELAHKANTAGAWSKDEDALAIRMAVRGRLEGRTWHQIAQGVAEELARPFEGTNWRLKKILNEQIIVALEQAKTAPAPIQPPAPPAPVAEPAPVQLAPQDVPPALQSPDFGQLSSQDRDLWQRLDTIATRKWTTGDEAFLVEAIMRGEKLDFISLDMSRKALDVRDRWLALKAEAEAVTGGHVIAAQKLLVTVTKLRSAARGQSQAAE